MPYGSDELMCNKCNKSLPISNFFKESSCKRCYRYTCKSCESQRYIDYRNKPENKIKATESRRQWVRKTKYNFPQELFEERLAEQQNVCAICKTDTPGGRGQFHADHDHDTNEPRGVLCHNCNVALGNFQDNPEILQAAIEYLKKYSEVE